MTLRDYILHYLYGAFAQGCNGAIAALVSAAGIDETAKFVKDMPAANLHTLLAIFVGTFAWNCVFYFKANPLPSSLPGASLMSAVKSVIPLKP